MKFELLSYTDYMERYLSHPSQRQRASAKREREWARLRRRLGKQLSKFGKLGNSGDENIDFFIGSDWFGDNCFHIVLTTWKLLQPEAMEALEEFLSANPACSVTIAHVSYDPKDQFEIFGTSDFTLLSMFERDAKEAARLLASHPVLSEFAKGERIGSPASKHKWPSRTGAICKRRPPR